MNHALIIFGIKSIIRIGRIGKAVSDQYARDSGAVFPELQQPIPDRRNFITSFFSSGNYLSYVDGTDAPYKEYWSTHGVIDDPNAVDALFIAAVKIKAEEGVDLKRWDYGDSETAAGSVLLKQWHPETAPLSPVASIILSTGDIVLEYVASNPGVMGVSGNGEKLLGAFAENLSDMLPGDGNFGVKHRFSERLLGAFLRAGLATISDYPEWVVSEEHMKKLISSAVTPVVESLPAGITQQLNYREVTDVLIGPAAGAAMRILAEHPDAFFGKDFKPEKAIGALTRGLFEQAAETGLSDQFSKEGLIELYRAALDVAAQKPQLFLDRDENPENRLAQDMFSNFASVLKNSPPPFDGNTGIQLAAAALAAVSSNAHCFAGADEPWEQTAAGLVSQTAGQLSDAFHQNTGIEKIFSKDQLVELGRVFLSHVAGTPEMIAGSRDALSQVAGAVAQAMAKDQKLLLNGEDWLEIARVAAEEAAANPARLFKPDNDDPAQVIASQIISAVLKSAGEIVDQPDLSAKTVLFGRTLREAVIIVLRATSGNPAAAQEKLQKIEALVKKLGEFVAANAERFGNKEWLSLFRMLLAVVMEGKDLPELSVNSASDLLAGG
jgi:hypothetical protein